MNSTERFKIVMEILDKNDLGNCSRNHSVFERLKDEELADCDKVKEVVLKIKEIEDMEENNTNKYPEYIMLDLRLRKGLDKYDFSQDDKLSKLEPDVVLSEVCSWNGLLGGWDSTIKDWIKDIYGIEL